MKFDNKSSFAFGIGYLIGWLLVRLFIHQIWFVPLWLFELDVCLFLTIVMGYLGYYLKHKVGVKGYD